MALLHDYSLFIIGDEISILENLSKLYRLQKLICAGHVKTTATAKQFPQLKLQIFPTIWESMRNQLVIYIVYMHFKFSGNQDSFHFDILISDGNDDVETLSSDTTNDVKFGRPKIQR